MVAWVAGVSRCFDENVFKAKLKAERSVSFICPGNDRARRVNIVKAAGLRDRGASPEKDDT
jgi:hypothetical protein